MSKEIEQWDTEEVLAFVHDVRPWRDLSDAERAEWCRRVKHVRDNVVTPDGERWTNAKLAGLFGLAEAGLEKRFRRSEQDTPPTDPVGRSSGQKVGDAKRAFRDPDLTADVLSDPEVRKAVTDAIGSDPEWTSDVVRSRQDAAGTPKAQPRQRSRDYDKLVDRAVNDLMRAIAAESSGTWTPNTLSEALLYFLGQKLGDRRMPKGDFEDEFARIEQYANTEAL